jgi:proteasome accessory factor C
MAEPASEQLNRIVQLVAELSRLERQGEPAPTLDELAERFDTKPSVILRDIRLMTEASDHPESTWLSSVTAYQEGNRVSLSSMGPYRRPVRLTGNELLALQVALFTDADNDSSLLQQLAGIATDVGDASFDNTVSALPALPGDQAAVVDLTRSAIDATKKLEIVYAAEGAERPSERVVQPHDIVSAEGRFYLIAWCERASDWRRFRCDRVLDATIRDDYYDLRGDAPEIEGRKDLFQPPEEGVDEVTIRFNPVISRWVLERYPEAKDCGNGFAVVTFKTASVDWLVRTVLEYGAEAEVLGPPAYREAVRRAVQTPSI